MDPSTGNCFTFHLTSRACLDRQVGSPTYIPEGFEREGFIHCTNGAGELAKSGNRHVLTDDREHVVLVIDLSMVSAEVRIAPDPGIYPHIHGPLNKEAIVAVRPAPRNDDGEFLIADLSEFEQQ
jgi:uncharacterized protein (DUF952 family)